MVDRLRAGKGTAEHVHADVGGNTFLQKRTLPVIRWQVPL